MSDTYFDEAANMATALTPEHVSRENVETVLNAGIRVLLSNEAVNHLGLRRPCPGDAHREEEPTSCHVCDDTGLVAATGDYMRVALKLDPRTQPDQEETA